MDLCSECKARSVTRETVHEFRYDGIGIPVILYDSVVRETCANCGEQSIEIPDVKGLIAAAAISRIMCNQKLKGKELRFLRSALGSASSEVAAMIDVQPETVSRWENDRAPMPPSSEKLFRYLIGSLLEEAAPAVFFDHKKVASMKIRAIGQEAEILLGFRRVSLKTTSKQASEPHWDFSRKAA